MWMGIKKTYWAVIAVVIAFLLIVAQCTGPKETTVQQIAAPAPAAGVTSGAPVVVNAPPASSGSEGFFTGLLAGHLFSSMSSGPRETVINRNYYSAPRPSVAPSAPVAPKVSVPSVPRSSASPSFSGAMRSFSGSSSSFRSSGSSFRSFGGFRR